jgi:hypothetical protein
MRKIMVIAAVLAATSAFAAIELPEASPGVSVTQEVGISKATINYHGPAVKGRKVFGDLVPYGKLWRLGANEATTLEISHPAMIAGNPVPAGKYALFAIPGADEWTFVINRKPQQWGAYSHDPKDDLVRFSAKPQRAEFSEWLEIDLTPVSEKAMRVDVQWENVRVPFNIEFDTPNLVWKQIETELASAPPTDWETWHQAARYAYQTGERLEQGLQWIDKALAASDSFWNYELKGQLLHKLGRTSEAYPLMEKAKTLAKGKAPDEWFAGVDKTVASWRAAEKMQ